MDQNTRKQRLEQIEELANNVKEHKQKEKGLSNCIQTVARVNCTINKIDTPNIKQRRTIWVVDDWMHTNIAENIKRQFIVDDGNDTIVFRSAELGRLLIRNGSGKHQYSVPSTTIKGRKTFNEVEIHSRVIWTNNPNNKLDAKDIMFNLGIGNNYMFDSLSELMKKLEEIKKQTETASPKMNLLGRGYTIKQAKLREQHYNNESQEKAIESHYFDNSVLVIEGGPGTGKTTTIINRLRYLLDIQHANSDSAKRKANSVKQYIANPNCWLYITPNSQLRNYVLPTISAYNIPNAHENIISIKELKERLFYDYLSDSKYNLVHDNRPSIIRKPQEAINGFKRFVEKGIGHYNDSEYVIDFIIQKYHDYRSVELRIMSGIYDERQLKDMLTLRTSSAIKIEEVCLLIGTLNHFVSLILNRESNTFDKCTLVPYKAYANNVKNIICVDEAADYSLLEYYLISSLCHHDTSTLTLCGEIMQRTSLVGINQWDELADIVGAQPDVKKLAISYRQLPKLVNLAKSMYLDEMGKEASYSPFTGDDDDDPKPTAFVSSDKEKRIEWIAKGIHQICEDFSRELPSVAIFVSDNYDEYETGMFIKKLKSHATLLDGIAVIDCTDSRPFEEQRRNTVRVFKQSEVKGMEFQSVFFYDIDVALRNESISLYRRHLYVGVSRAASHLYATFTSSENMEVLKYFIDCGVVEGDVESKNMMGRQVYQVIIDNYKNHSIEEITQALVAIYGQGIITEMRYVGLLLDLQKLNGNYDVQFPLETFINKGYTKQLIEIKERDSIHFSKLLSTVKKETYMDSTMIKRVFRMLALGLGWEENDLQ